MFNDNFKPQAIDQKKLKKLKGHIKLTLTNAKTGEVEKVIEGDNIVTNAVSDLLSTDNYFGLVDFTKLTPVYQKFFSGCLLLKNPFDVDASNNIPRDDDYYIKGNHINPVTAHAGDQVPSDFGDDTTRGYPNDALLVKNKKSLTMAWTWPATHGNGEIASIALTTPLAGNCGTGSTSNAFKASSMYTKIQRNQLTATMSLIGQLDDRVGIDYTFDPSEGHFRINYYKIAFNEVGIYEDLVPEQMYWSNTYLTYFKNCPSAVYSFDQDNKVLWFFGNVRSVSQYSARVYRDRFWYVKLPFKWFDTYWGIDFDNMSTDIVTVDVQNLSSFSLTYRARIPHQMKKIEGGVQDIFYFPTGPEGEATITGIKRLNFQNRSDTSEIILNEPISAFNSGMCGRYDGDLIEVNGRLINGLTGFTCTDPLDGDERHYMIQVNEVACANLFPNRARILLNNYIYTTKFNLKESVMKTSAQQMTLEYTLTEVDDYAPES